MPCPDDKQDKITNPIISTEDSQKHSKIYHLTQPSPLEGEKTQTSLPPTRMQAQFIPNTKLTQTTGPNLLTEGRNQMEEGL